jgi:predicted PurR-regulated permease PerM
VLLIVARGKFDLLDLRKHLAIILFLILGFVSYSIIKTYILSLIIGSILAFIFFPIYNWMNKLIKHKVFCSIALTIVILILISIPFTFLVNMIGKESYGVYVSAQQFISQEDAFLRTFNCTKTDTDHMACSALRWIEENTNEQIINQVENTVISVTQGIIRNTASFLAAIPGTILQFVVMILTMFMVFIEGPLISEKIKVIIPLSKKHTNKLYHEFSNIVNGVIYGQILTAIVQAAVAYLGFYFFGVRSPIIWALFTAFFSLIPFLGAASIWAPISIVKIIIALATNNPIGIGQGIGLGIYGFFVISLVDNFIKPKFIGDKSNLNAILALVSILGGLATFGIAGVIIGPVIIAMFLAILNIYIDEVKHID